MVSIGQRHPSGFCFTLHLFGCKVYWANVGQARFCSLPSLRHRLSWGQNKVSGRPYMLPWALYGRAGWKSNRQKSQKSMALLCAHVWSVIFIRWYGRMSVWTHICERGSSDEQKRFPSDARFHGLFLRTAGALIMPLRYLLEVDSSLPLSRPSKWWTDFLCSFTSGLLYSDSTRTFLRTAWPPLFSHSPRTSTHKGNQNDIKGKIKLPQ